MAFVTTTLIDNGLDVDQLAEQLRAAGLPIDSDILVHCSMRRLGPTLAGPATVLEAITAVIGPSATVVVPTQTANNSTTSPSFRAATRGMTPAEINDYIQRLPGFDRAATPSFRMGALAEHVRTRFGAVRSTHPQTSFTALGPSAGRLMAVHALTSHLGERSPLAALYRGEANVLLLGVGFDVCTAFHLAEYRLRRPNPIRPYSCFVRTPTGRQRRDFAAVHLDDRDFGQLGVAMASRPWVRSRPVGNATATVFPIRRAVDFAIDWMNANRRR